MAAAVSRPGRMLAVVAVLLVGLYLAVFLGPSATPKLGLDLRGGTQVILKATPIKGSKVTSGALSQAVDIIRQRVDAAGVGGAEINTQGGDNIIVSAPGANRQQLDALDQTALLRFRQVLVAGAGTQTVTPKVSTSPVPGTTPSTAITLHPSPTASKTTSKDRLPSALLDTNTTAKTTKASTSPAPSPSVSAAPSATASGSASPSPSASPAAHTPIPGSESKDLATVEAAFATLDCSKNSDPTAGLDDPASYILACDDPKTGSAKYILAPTGVEGSEISSADATVDPQTNQWLVQLNFKSKGADQWLKLTAAAAKLQQVPNCSPPTGCNAVAVVLDGVVQSAPYISDPNGIPGGRAQITGHFTQKQATTLANVLKFGALPLKLNKLTEDSVSATLGSAQLRGGLIAGLIGLGLVILYSLLYYRALGFVTIASLALSGMLLYGVTTVLGHSSLNYTLSLAGIAGFIVAVGITADSFVVFFERLRDEVREGRRLRSGVERAWPRARRTIISADSVSLLAAVVLYIVSIGDVRGFAFTLGMSTISDLFIVFFFTKPLLALLSRTSAFDSGAGWTGIGKARSGAILEAREA